MEFQEGPEKRLFFLLGLSAAFTFYCFPDVERRALGSE